MDLKETAKRSYQLKINYAQTKDMLVGNCISTLPFKVGGHKWSINYYPKACDNTDKCKWASFFLELVSENSVNVKACFSLTLTKPFKLNKITGENSQLFPSVGSKQGFRRFVKTKELEDLKDDVFLELEGKVSVSDDSILAESTVCSLGVSPFDLHEQIGELWTRREKTDIIFDLNGEMFHAHRLILAARSPVFRAELSGSMVESKSKSKCITIKEMLPSHFEALLQFIYTDRFPSHFEPKDASHSSVMDLYITADRYDIQGLRVMCEKKLSENITLDNVMVLLDFAEGYNCMRLKEACLEYIVLPENFAQLGVMDAYFAVIPSHPSLLKDLQRVRKKQKIN